MSLQAQNDFDKEWKKVQDLMNKKGLTASATKLVDSIYANAKSTGNDAQVIKALLFKCISQQQKEQDADVLNIKMLEKELAEAKGMQQHLLASMTAEKYWQYYQNHRWQILQRSKTQNFKKEDFQTWSIDDFTQKISALYLGSLADKNALQKFTLEKYDAVLVYNDFRFLRPTMYDFLAHRALPYFKNDERDVSKPAYAFQLSDAAMLGDAATFSKAKITTKDTSSLHLKATQIYQELLRLHANDNSKDALIELDIDRLQFMHGHSVHPDKEKLYEASLEKLANQYANDSASAQASFLLAGIYKANGEKYDPLKSNENQYEIKRAKELCESISKKFPKSEGGINCLQLLQEINRPSIELTTEKVEMVDKPFRMLVTYKNMPRLYFRLLKMTREQWQKLMEAEENGENKSWEKLVAFKFLKTWNVDLPDLKDYQSHSVELKVDPLQNGLYVILASRDENFSMKENIMARQLQWVSDLSYIHQDNEYIVLHRRTGKPIANANVQQWFNRYNYNNRKYNYEKGALVKTDANGLCALPKVKNEQRGNFQLEIKTANDYLYLSDEMYSGYYYDNDGQRKETVHTHLFTDRAIYRPGQTVYFKGIKIITSADGKTHAIATASESEIWLRDANGQKAAEQKLKTNEYGSYSGNFKLPEGLLNGYFTLWDNTAQSNIGFRVEEYKRPKFFVEVKKPSGTYRLNDSVKVIGMAKAYAGNVVDGAKVKYVVKREVRYPDWWYDWGYSPRSKRGGGRWGGNNGSSMEITNGETTTNAKGEFTVTFNAIPDLSVPKKDQPTFSYNVSAEVTDLNGETRTAETSVAVAYQSVQLSINLPSSLQADSLKSIQVNSTNMNGLFEAAKVQVTMHKLQQPNRLFRSRYWEQPDQHLISQQEYERLFPFDIWGNEDQRSSWAQGTKYVDSSYTTAEGKGMQIKNAKFETGIYLLVASTVDKYGEKAETKTYIELMGAQPQINNSLEATVDQTRLPLQPGDKVKYSLKTTVPDLYVVHQLNRMNDRSERKFLTINQAMQFEHAVEEQDRGGMDMNYAYVFQNRTFTGDSRFYVPWANKELVISYASFRDKTLPGSKEEWKLKITGYKKDKVAAEMLATMYDASLDQFAPHAWYAPSLYPGLSNNQRFTDRYNFVETASEENNLITTASIPDYMKRFEALNWGLIEQPFKWVKGKKKVDLMWWVNGLDYGYWNNLGVSGGSYKLEGRVEGMEARPMHAAPSMARMDEVVVTGYGGRKKKDLTGAMSDVGRKSQSADEDGVAGDFNNEQSPPPPTIQPRKNFNETAFFLPDLQTDSAGNISFSFTMPEALTEWKFLGLAHTKDLAFGSTTQKLITQKQLMVQPYAPRFLREGDKINLTAKISNLTDKELSGTAILELIDPATNKPVDGEFKNIYANQHFTAAAAQSASVSFNIDIPFNFNKPLTYRIVAIAGAYSDGEEASLPVLTNRMLITESQTLHMRGNGTKKYSFDKLLKSDQSTTISQHAVTVEYTSNPTWYAVQALPYLMEYPYECAEQTWNRYYANALASYIVNKAPRIKAIFEKWKSTDTAALISNLMKNEELKSVLLQETPWVMAAQDETQQKKNIALLFDLVHMSAQLNSAYEKLKQLQSSNGGFVWFKGGPDDRYITQYVATGIGHLQKLGAVPDNQKNNLQNILNNALPYLDKRIADDYAELKRYAKGKKITGGLGYLQIQYLYMRSFFKGQSTSSINTTAFNYYIGETEKNWLTQNRYQQAMMALALHRNGNKKTALGIMVSLKENALTNEELGMYYKDNGGGYYWYQAPVETQALLIEAFADILNDNASVDNLKTWLLKQKQTTNWKTTVATAEACYALLLQGAQWLTAEPKIAISLGGTPLQVNVAEAGTGYIKTRIDGDRVKPTQGNIEVTVSEAANANGSGMPTWGAVYWQYFEDIDKVTTAATPLRLERKLFVENNTDKGKVLTPVADNATLKVGDKIVVRIELRSDRNMEYVHMKDLRAANMEPTNVLSQYKWQAGLGYYESTKDASTNFFISYLPRGTYVFEYSLFITHTGNYSAGLSTIQCMYAPEFNAHSEGVRIKVNE